MATGSIYDEKRAIVDELKRLQDEYDKFTNLIQAVKKQQTEYNNLCNERIHEYNYDLGEIQANIAIVKQDLLDINEMLEVKDCELN